MAGSKRVESNVSCASDNHFIWNERDVRVTRHACYNKHWYLRYVGANFHNQITNFAENVPCSRNRSLSAFSSSTEIPSSV